MFHTLTHKIYFMAFDIWEKLSGKYIVLILICKKIKSDYIIFSKMVCYKNTFMKDNIDLIMIRRIVQYCQCTIKNSF